MTLTTFEILSIAAQVANNPEIIITISELLESFKRITPEQKKKLGEAFPEINKLINKLLQFDVY